MKKIGLFLMFFGWGVFVSTDSFSADPIALDAGRVTNLTQENAGRGRENGAQVEQNDQQEEINKTYNTDCTVQITQMDTAYDYVKSEILEKADKDEFGQPQSTQDSALTYVTEHYFYKSDDPLNSEKEAEIERKRIAYLMALQSTLEPMTTEILKRLDADEKALAESDMGGCGILQDIAINTETMRALVKQTIAELALQIRLMELDAVTAIQMQPVKVQSKPETPAPSDTQ